MAQWTDEDPGAGDTGDVATASTTLGDLAERVGQVVTAVNGAAGGLGSGVWTGTAADTWSTNLTTLSGDLGPVKSAYTTAAAALASYVTTVDDIRARAVPLIQRLGTARIAKNQTYMDGSEGPTPAQQDQRDQDKQDAIREENYVLGELEALAEERRTADTAVQTALTGAVPATWPAQRAALAAIGIDSIDEADSTSIARAMADLASSLANADDIDPADLQRLTDLYALYADDPSVMAKMNLQLGGTDLVSLIDRLGDQALDGSIDPGAALALATLVRQGFSTGSAEWTAATGSRFADQMFEGVSYTVGGGMSAIGFLFGDAAGNPVGETTALAAALLVDDWERVNGTGSTIDVSPNAGGAFLSTLAEDQPGLRVRDAAGRILETLGEYPDSAHEFMTDATAEDSIDGDASTTGNNRIDYWFGQRDWSDFDGFTGPASLWSGAQQINGGPADPTGAYDEDAWNSAADLSSRAMQALVDNPSYLSENVSDVGAVHLAEAFLPQMQGITETPVLENTAPDADHPGTFDVDLLGDEEYRRAAAVISREDLGKFLSGIGGSDAATGVLRDAASSYREVLVANAAVEGTPGAMYDAIRRSDAFTAVLDGSGLGSGVGETIRSDAAVSAAVDGAKEVVGLIPIPGASKLLVEGGNAVLDWGQSQAEGWLTDQGGNALESLLGGNQTDAARAAAALEGQERTDLLTFSNLETMYALAEPDGGWQGIEAPPQFTADPSWSTAEYEEHAAAFGDEARAWSEAHGDDIDAAYQEATGSDEGIDALETRYESLRDEFEDYARQDED